VWPAINSAFRFLVDEHGFRAVGHTGQVSYLADDLIVFPTSDQRDGFDIHLEFPSRGSASVSLGTVMAALGASSSRIDEHATFLRKTLVRFRQAKPTLYEDLIELRFWHAPHWRKEWGFGITMTEAAIATEQERLNRLRTYFESRDSTPNDI